MLMAEHALACMLYKPQAASADDWCIRQHVQTLQHFKDALPAEACLLFVVLLPSSVLPADHAAVEPWHVSMQPILSQNSSVDFLLHTYVAVQQSICTSAVHLKRTYVQACSRCYAPTGLPYARTECMLMLKLARDPYKVNTML